MIDATYFHGKPCRNGHDGTRYSHDKSCVECGRIKARNRNRKRLPSPTRPCPQYCELCGMAPSREGNNNKGIEVRGMHLDHDHKTGKFRGWLCGKCNMALGKFGDSITGLQDAILYLQRNTNRGNIPHDRRKEYPIATGVLDYFDKAICEIAHVSYMGNEQHNPGTPLHWDRSKSSDEADALMRHFKDRGTLDSDGLRHTAKLAWRACALLQKELENEK